MILTSERVPSPSEDEEDVGPPVGGHEEKRRIGPLSDYADSGLEFYPTADAKALFDHLNAPRNPDREVRVSEERESVGARLEEVSELIDKEKEKEGALGAVRSQLGVSHDAGDTLKKLEKAKEKLEEDARHIELAATYNDTLDSFGDTSRFSGDDIEHIAKTGRTKKGEHLRDRHGKEIHSDVARELAHLYQSGGRRMTWGKTIELRKIREVADRILHDAGAAIKGMFRGSKEGAN